MSAEIYYKYLHVFVCIFAEVVNIFLFNGNSRNEALFKLMALGEVFFKDIWKEIALILVLL